MKTSRVLVIAALPLLFAPGAEAQSADTQYCMVLGSQYDRYVNNPSRGLQPPNARIDEAKAQCGGNPSYAIPILEQALKDARVCRRAADRRRRLHHRPQAGGRRRRHDDHPGLRLSHRGETAPMPMASAFPAVCLTFCHTSVRY